ncbi:ABC transporter ATP-binding protein [Ignavigranum ruoffiae]|uniref:ABC transporter ATP-binding protein n=1 Tax=Ignavigranum ruoffiae TaxID=89093 RepID=UPI00204C9193|nr:ABC transporter ATP-binding protein [Ignavigranum ruoffiae]UPQ86328.1 ABC transporter ATP-binding protein [Ignavigranum ruoffiae]
MLEIKDIEVTFGDFVAIKDINISINQGEFFSFLGPSGCGKTTTLRTIVGFVKPSKGSITIDHKEITYEAIEDRGIGIIFQSYALFPTMTVRENIEFGMKEHKWSRDKIEQRVKEVSTLVNLNQAQLKKKVSELSGGQQQRVAIARALSLQPDIICLDEPLSNLDAKLRKSLRSELKRIQASSNATMIYVTHDQEEALALSDRVAVFSNGEIQQIGTPEEIYYQPKNQFVAEFIGDRIKLDNNLLNLINAKEILLSENQDHYINIDDLTVTPPTSVDRRTIVLPATLVSEEFLGSITRRVYEVQGSNMTDISFSNSLLPLEIGDSVDIYVSLENICSFDKETK